MSAATDQEKGDAAIVSRMSLGVHTGTHMDAPLHFDPNARVHRYDSARCHRRSGESDSIGDTKSIRPEELLPHAVSAGERILFKTANSDHCWDSDRFDENFVFISRGPHGIWRQGRVRSIGVDYLSVGGFHQDERKRMRAMILNWDQDYAEGLESSWCRAGPIFR